MTTTPSTFAATDTRARQVWLPRPAAPTGALRLFCFPHAGSGASAFRAWQDGLPPGITVLPVQLPGREERFREQPYRDVRALVADLVGHLADLFRQPYALFGHSMGALVAFETAREALRRDLPGPVGLIVSGRGSPRSTDRLPPLHNRSDEGFAAALRELGGTPESVLRDPDLRSLLFPLLRADFALNETYRPAPGPSLDCPITVLGGTRDVRVPVADLAGWADHTSGPVRTHLIGAGHFFVNERRRDVLVRVREALAPWTG